MCHDNRTAAEIAGRTHTTRAQPAARRPRLPVSPELWSAQCEGAAVVTDQVGRVVTWGAYMEQIVGYPAEELEDAPLPLSLLDSEQLARRAEVAGVAPGLGVLLLPPSSFDRRRDRQVDLGSLDRRNRDTDAARPPSCDWTLVHRDGHEVIVSVSVAPVLDAGSQLVGYQARCLDVTEERRTHSLLVQALIKEREATRRLAELDHQRDQFVATASHELRTPVASILGYAELLQDQEVQLDPGARAWVAAITRNAARLRGLSESLLMLSRSDAGHRGERGPTDLAHVVSGAWEPLAALDVARGLDLACEVPATPVTVLGEAQSLERVVLNLVGNALKFTPDGGRVHCSLDVTGSHALLRVDDTGIGIPAEDQPQLFSRFFRGAAARDGAIQGTGLGLSIVRSIVDEHGGEIGVESEPGRGTTVTVTLPLASGHDEAAPALDT